MSSVHSITRLLSGVKRRDIPAVEALFRKCYDRVAEIGRRKLAGNALRGFDEDDVANSVFREFFRRAGEGSFKELEDHKDVWQILTLLVGDKVKAHFKHEGRKKRGGGKRDAAIQDIAEQISKLPGPELEAMYADAMNRFLAELPNSEHRRVVELLVVGLSQEEIAQNLGVSVRTIARRLEVIRSTLPRILGIGDTPCITKTT